MPASTRRPGWLARTHRQVRETLLRLLREHASPARLAWAVAVGLFVGTLPLYGLHLPICLLLASALGLNRGLTYLAANISNPLLAPVLVAAGIAIGEWLRFGRWRGLDLDAGRDFLGHIGLLAGRLPDLFLSCLLGSVVLGLGFAVVGGVATWVWARRHQGDQGVR